MVEETKVRLAHSAFGYIQKKDMKGLIFSMGPLTLPTIISGGTAQWQPAMLFGLLASLLPLLLRSCVCYYNYLDGPGGIAGHFCSLHLRVDVSASHTGGIYRDLMASRLLSLFKLISSCSV